MTTRNALLLGAILTAGVTAYHAAIYPTLPEMIPTHWGINGEVDGWGNKTTALFFGPGMMALILFLTVALPWMSPRNFAVETFRETFNYIMLMMVGLMGFVSVIMVEAALHPEMDSGRWAISGIFALLALIGNVMGKVRRNFWMGFRTPWTLASDKVWYATHRLGAKLMVATGLLGAILVGAGAPIWLSLILLMVGALYPALYSLVLYKRLEGEGKLNDSVT